MTDCVQVSVRWTTVERAATLDPDLEARLADVDRARAVQFGSPEARSVFMVGRSMRRDVLSRMGGVSPDRLGFTIGPRGKPQLTTSPDLALAFNVSHSHGIVALAVARAADIGIDVEAVRPVASVERLARRFLAPTERDAVMARTEPDRSRAFLTVWTRKEAWLKATGRGISVRLSAVEVEADCDRHPRIVALPEGCGRAGDWSLLPVQLPLEAVATVCVPVDDWELDIAEWRPSV